LGKTPSNFTQNSLSEGRGGYPSMPAQRTSRNRAMMRGFLEELYRDEACFRTIPKTLPVIKGYFLRFFFGFLTAFKLCSTAFLASK